MKYLIATMTLSSLFFSMPAFAGLKIKTSDFIQTNLNEQSLPKVKGEIKKIDLDQRKLTVKHSEIPNLNMPGMTMVFKVSETVDLSQLKIADQILFTADKINGAYTILTIEK